MKPKKADEPDRRIPASRPSVTVPGDKHMVLGVCSLLVGAVFLVFGQTFWHGFINFDDDLYVYNNPHVVTGLKWENVGWAFTHSYVANWHPLTWLSHMLDCQLYGLNAGGHHLTSVLLHTATAILLFLALRRMTGTPWPSAFVAAVFAIHPLRVESVAWISERKDVLSGFFFMLTLLMYARYAEQSKIQNPKPMVYYGLTLVFFAMGLMSKPMVVTLPFVLLLLDYWPLQRFTNHDSRFKLWPLVREKIPLFLLAGISCGVVFVAQKSAGAVITLENVPLSARVSNALVSCGIYAGQMLWPENLAVFYPYNLKAPIWLAASAGTVLFLATLIAIQQARRLPYLLVGWLWYLGMLMPVIGIVQVGVQSHADRYTYLPQIGLYLMVAWTLKDLSATWRYRRQLLSVAAVIIMSALMVCASIQTSYWRNGESLWTHSLACIPSAVAHDHMGTALISDGLLDQATKHFQSALEIMPRYPEAQNHLGVALFQKERMDEAIYHFQKALEIRPTYAEASYNLGSVLLKKGRLNEAAEQYQRSIQLKPDYAEACYELGNLLAKQNRFDEAIGHYQKAIQFKPDYAEAYYNLGVGLAALGRSSEAIEKYQKAMQINSSYPEAAYNLAQLLAAQGDSAEAVLDYEKTVRLKPDWADAHNNLANLLAAQGRLDEAIDHYQKALQLNPNQAQADYNLGVALALQGRLVEAVNHYQKALQLKPDYAEAQYNLGMVLAAQGRLDEAIRHFQKTIQLMPDLAQAHYQLGLALQAQHQDEAATIEYRNALGLATRKNDRSLIGAIQGQLKLFPNEPPYQGSNQTIDLNQR